MTFSSVSALGQAVCFLLVPFLPLAFSFAFLLGKRVTLLTRLAPLSLMPALAAVVVQFPDSSVYVSGLLLGTTLRLTPMLDILLLFTAFLWFAGLIYADSYMKNVDNKSKFYFFYMLALCGNLGLIIAGDLIGFYCFFALMSFSSYGLVVADGHRDAFFAGKVYITFVMLSEMALLTAFIFIATASDSITLSEAPQAVLNSPFHYLILALLIVGFGVKAGVLLLHVWLPLAHSVSPTPASAVLSGAMIKAGVVGWLLFLPIGLADYPATGLTLVVLGIASSILSAVVGFAQDKPKSILAYSSVGQMGLATLLVGLALYSRNQAAVFVLAITWFVVHHGLAKAALFLSVGLVSHLPADQKIMTFKSMSLTERLVWISMGLLGLSLAGAPLTSGMIAKSLIKTPAAHADIPAFVLPFLYLSSVFTGLLMLRFVLAVWRDRREFLKRAVDTPQHNFSRLNVLGMVVGYVLLVVAALSYVYWVPLQIDISVWKWETISSASYPLIIIAMLVVVGRLLQSRTSLVYPSIATGDILVVCLPFLSRAYSQLVDSANNQLPNFVKAIQSSLLTLIPMSKVEEKLVWSEKVLARWDVAAMLLILIGVLVYVTLLIVGAA